MHRHKILISSGILAGVLLLALPVFAQVDVRGEVRIRGDAQVRPLPVRPVQVLPDRVGDRPFIREEHSAPQTAVRGLVVRVGASDFALALPALRDKATTTVVVSTSASTTFVLRGARASFANVAIGLHASAEGRLSTSTNTLEARHVVLAPETPEDSGRGSAVRATIQEAMLIRMNADRATTTPFGQFLRLRIHGALGATTTNPLAQFLRLSAESEADAEVVRPRLDRFVGDILQRFRGLFSR